LALGLGLRLWLGLAEQHQLYARSQHGRESLWWLGLGLGVELGLGLVLGLGLRGTLTLSLTLTLTLTIPLTLACLRVALYVERGARGLRVGDEDDPG